METITRSGRTTTELHHMSKKWKDHRTAQRSPEHNKVWTEPPPARRKVPVVYYLSRNGNLEHPHFIEVPLSSSDGLYLRDVIDRLNSLRGKGMAALYSWSSKRSYKNGFVWHDLAENDYIYPAHGQEYVLKGSELVVVGGASLSSKSEAAVVSLSKNSLSPDDEKCGDDDFPVVRRRRNQSWSAIDLHEYKVYTGESSAGKGAADASTQTDDKRRRRRAVIREEKEEEEIKEEEEGKGPYQENESSELSREEISPPPSDSSPETLESLMKADGKLILRPETECNNPKVNPTASIKIKTSSALMQLISCGSISFRDCGPGAYGKDNPGFSLISHYKSRMLPRGDGARNNTEEATVEDAVVLRKNRRIKKQVVTEDKEYFSGSLIETKKEEFPALKRSNSYNADR